MSVPKITFEGVSKSFNIRQETRGRSGDAAVFTALQDINLAIPEGEFFVVVGPSGCGKSTLLDIAAGLTAPSAGRVLLDGRPVTGPGLDRAVVFQQYALLPWRTARANIELSLEAEGIPRRERTERARQFLDLVGLLRFENRYPHELSGGMKQRVAIARSLAHDPAVLLMDEPFAALDAQTRESLQAQLRQIWEKAGKTVIFITHGIEEAVYLGQRVGVMTSRPGRIKQIIDVPLDVRNEANDPRASAEFVRLRHEIWSLLHDEVAEAQRREVAA
jgi:NitT/TauT family transport system ATP-binding protein